MRALLYEYLEIWILLIEKSICEILHLARYGRRTQNQLFLHALPLPIHQMLLNQLVYFFDFARI